jgi:L(+)-tartrate dehydratase beta subunit
MASEKYGHNSVRLKLPVKAEDLQPLEIGTVVYLDGLVYTGREGVYKKVLDEGSELPPGITELSNANFHCSPAAAVEDDGSYNIGGVTATASCQPGRST